MKHSFLIVALTVLVAVPLAAQAPKGWLLRIDRSTTASDPDAAGAIKFVTMGTGFHATNPQAAIYWNPTNTVTGNYTLKGTFTLMKPSGHVNYYGLFFNGTALDGPKQHYIYFVIGQDGTWLTKFRNGEATQELSSKMPSEAIKMPDASGKATNDLEVRVTADSIAYVVNGTVVSTSPKSGRTAMTDGIYGVRVNHLLEVQVDGFGVTKQ